MTPTGCEVCFRLMLSKSHFLPSRLGAAEREFRKWCTCHSLGEWRGIIGFSLFHYPCSKIFVISLLQQKRTNCSIDKIYLLRYSAPGHKMAYSVVPSHQSLFCYSAPQNGIIAIFLYNTIRIFPWTYLIKYFPVFGEITGKGDCLFQGFLLHQCLLWRCRLTG